MILRHANKLEYLTKISSSKKTIVQFVDCKYCKKALSTGSLLTLTMKQSTILVKIITFSLMKI